MENNNRQDPDPFAIAALLIAGAGLLLNLEQKIEARSNAKRKESDESARTDLRVRLGRIRRSLAIIQDFWRFFEENGYYEAAEIEGLPGGFGSSRKYFDDIEYREFNRRLDEALKHIGSINKELYAIKLDDIVISGELKRSFKIKLVQLRNELNSLIIPSHNITEQLMRVKDALALAGDLIVELHDALGISGKESDDGAVF